ncbi:MAG: Cys-Gln thioester bond-forming surface protein [Thermodesulfobacteriota bacterium]
MRRLVALFALLLVLAPWAAAQADTITYNGVQQAGLNIKGYVDYSRRYASTGEFDISWNEEEVLAAYCADILSSGLGGSYNVSALSNFDYHIYNNLYRAAWIMENYAPGLGYDSSYYSDTVAATAVQSAVWALLTPYRYSPFSLSSVTSGSSTEKSRAKALYTQILAASAGIDFGSYAFQNMFYFADSNQDKQNLLFATAQPGPSVPEPGTMLLMGSALLSGLGLRRKQIVQKLRELLKKT